MAFADSITINPGTGDVVLKRTGFSPKGVFTSADGTLVLELEQITGKGNTRDRITARLTLNKVVADVYNTTRSIPVSVSVYQVINRPKLGFAAADQISLAKGLDTWLLASTQAAITQLVGGES